MARAKTPSSTGSSRRSSTAAAGGPASRHGRMGSQHTAVDFADDAGTAELSDMESAQPFMTRQKPFAWLLLGTGIVSWLSSGILVLDRLELYKNPNAVTNCDINAVVSCGSVMKTHQAEIFGFSNPLIGLFAFAVVITTGMAMLSGARLGRWYWIGLQTGVTLGMAMICWLWFQAVYVISILCPYCMVVWAMMIMLFIWTTVRNLVHGVLPAPAGVTRFLSEWAWILAALLALGVIASIFFRFINLFVPGVG
ncbi:vitamin K epoxide reductase family protein [Paenarthrobacter sp. Z7-10]|uniref:vitamin K epoxide reductase family protein n=1 Tax=Paenarthrobacter sp. Z7-10 TaxID=2787635 RepID=UPI0022A8DEC1|nr:vitamin K epoxide reductase family protein [Paenarthrobacter sp. Z7-10]MCZ2403943.1 vitamin K epoxide reductase family protein [Paenarthrobacter sp. Z7-10]